MNKDKRGWIRLQRKIRDHWLWDNKEVKSKFEAWIDLLMMASHRERTVYIKDQLVTIKRGEVCCSLNAFAKRWKWSTGKVRRFISVLKTDTMVVQQTTRVATHLSICNYDTYQGGRHADGTPDGMSNDTQTKRERYTENTLETLKELKKEKETPASVYMKIWKRVHDRFGLPEMSFAGYTHHINEACKRIGVDNVNLCIDRFFKDKDTEIKQIRYFFQEGIDRYLVVKDAPQKHAVVKDKIFNCFECGAEKRSKEDFLTPDELWHDCEMEGEFVPAWEYKAKLARENPAPKPPTEEDNINKVMQEIGWPNG